MNELTTAPLQAEYTGTLTFTAEDEANATKVAEELDRHLATIRHHETELGSSYVEVGALLLEVRSHRYWMLWRHKTFDDFLESIGAKWDKGRTQLYGYIGVVEKLLPAIGKPALVRMGISKAQEIKRMYAATGRLPAEIVEKAEKPEVNRQELRVAIGEATNFRPENERGTYRDLGGFYATKEEWDEILQGFGLAARTDPVIDEALSAWERLKQIILRLCQEYASTYAESVARGEG